MLMPKFVQVGRVDKYLSLLPVQIAAPILESFYNVVIDTVRQKWIEQQPVNSFTITWENIELEFSSATRTIPVRHFPETPLPIQRCEFGVADRFRSKTPILSTLCCFDSGIIFRTEC